MKFVAAYLLAVYGSNPSPTKAEVRTILDSVGAEIEEDKLELLFTQVEGRDVSELLAAGREKFAFGSGGAVATAGAAAAGEKEEEKKAEEKKEEEEEEEDLDMFSLFD